MPKTRLAWAFLVLALLALANIVYFFFYGWGLITVHAHHVPLAQVVKSIQRQGSATIYSNIDSSATVSMDVVRVPLAEAMETLAANVTVESSESRRPSPVQWKLAFFAAPTSGQVQQEIRDFQGGTAGGDETKIYSYPTPLQMLGGSESGLPAADPRLQLFTGMTAPAPAPTAPADGNADAGAAAPPPAPPSPSTIQDYLDNLAQGADIWVMAPASWSTKVSSAPGTGTAIAKAVKSVVSQANGAVQQAFVLYTRSGGRGGGGGFGGGRGFGGGGDTGWATMENRMRNAINGLPAEARAPAQEQLTQEIAFQKQVRAAPPDQRRQMFMAHRMDRMEGGFMRLSPEKRAQMYSRAVANRQNVRGK